MRIFLCLLFCALSASAANVRFAFTNYGGLPDTNWFYVIPVNDAADASGGFVTRGPATRLTPNANGIVTNSFEMGNYVVSNRFLSRGFVIRVPNDHGPTVYCATCATNNTPQGSGLAISGFNTFVTIVYGTNPPPTYDEITNSLGYLPLTPAQATNIANAAGGRSQLAPGVTNASGAVVFYGNSMEFIDPNTGWTNANTSDQTLSTANTNVFDWFNQWLIGTWTANGLLFTNIPRGGVTGLTNALTYLSNNTAGVDVAAGINITVTTNGNLRTIAASAVTDPVALTNNETRVVTFRGPNDADWSMTNKGTAMFENGLIVSNRDFDFQIRTADGVTQLRQTFNQTGIRVTSIGGNGAALTNLTAASITAGGTLPPLNAGNLTNFYAATNFDITVSRRGIANSLSTRYNDGLMFGPDTPGTTTSGLQEALNFRTGGDSWVGSVGYKIRLGEGSYFFTNKIVVSNSAACNLWLEGAGPSATRLVYAGNETGIRTFDIRGSNGVLGVLNMPMAVVIKDVCFTAVTDTTNVLLRVTNYVGAELERVMFCDYATAAAGWMSLFPPGGNVTTPGLVGMEIGGGGEFRTVLKTIDFFGLADGMYVTCDHFYAYNITCGLIGWNSSSLWSTKWPTNSIYNLGAAIIRKPGLNSHYIDPYFYAANAGLICLPESDTESGDIQVLEQVRFEDVTRPFGSAYTNGIEFEMSGHNTRDGATHQGYRITNSPGYNFIAAPTLNIKRPVLDENYAQNSRAGVIWATQFVQGARSIGFLGSGTFSNLTAVLDATSNYKFNMNLPGLQAQAPAVAFWQSDNGASATKLFFNSTGEAGSNVWLYLDLENFAGGVQMPSATIGRVGGFSDTSGPLILGNVVTTPNAELTLLNSGAIAATAGFFAGNGSGLTNIQEQALVYPPANPAAGLVLTSTSSNTAAWLAPSSGGEDGTQWKTNGNSSLPAGSVLGTLDNFDLQIVSSNATLARLSGYSNHIILGIANQITGWQNHSTIAGGRGNLINGRTNSAQNRVLGYNFIGGGATNSINEAAGQTVGRNFIGGGFFNSILDGGADAHVIVGGGLNTNEGAFGFIGGGSLNYIPAVNTYSNGQYATIPGGSANTASGDYSFAAGRSNTVTGIGGFIAGGLLNSAPGSNSLAAGFRAKSQHTGSFVWSDSSSESTFTSAGDNTFNVRAAGGANFSGTVRVDGVITGNGSGITNVGGIKVWRGLVSQSGSSAPTATVLENSLGTITWARSSAGVYTATVSPAGAFTSNKTHILAATPSVDAAGITQPVNAIKAVRTSTTVITFSLRYDSGSDSSGALSDDLWGGDSVEILVYP